MIQSLGVALLVDSSGLILVFITMIKVLIQEND
jgi:hypothetical protein